MFSPKAILAILINVVLTMILIVIIKRTSKRFNIPVLNTISEEV